MNHVNLYLPIDFEGNLSISKYTSKLTSDNASFKPNLLIKREALAVAIAYKRFESSANVDKIA